MIDWNRVSELRDEIGPDDFGEVVELFLDEVETEIETLRVNYEKSRLESQLHFLKGSALNLGFEEFSRKCQQGETAASQGEANGVDIPNILSCYDASKTEFLGRLDRIDST